MREIAVNKSVKDLKDLRLEFEARKLVWAIDFRKLHDLPLHTKLRYDKHKKIVFPNGG